MKLLGLKEQLSERMVEKNPKTIQDTNPVDKSRSDIVRTVPGSRVSTPSGDTTMYNMSNNLTISDYSHIQQFIPLIRKLYWQHPDVGLVIHDLVQLTNTGHKVQFDGAKPEQVKEMRKYLKNVSKDWGDGVAGIHGLVNRLIAQTWVGGATSAEWVVNLNKTGIEKLAIVDPETVVFQWNSRKKRFEPYQKQSSAKARGNAYQPGLKKLNQQTYKYLGINGDQEIPYGIPPFLTALLAITDQSNMNKNISHILEKSGFLGFLETLLEKPMQNSDENDKDYTNRLKNLLDETKKNLENGMNEGIVVGYKDDHEFNFNSTTKDLNGISELWNLNQGKIANGLKTPPTFLGVPGSGGTETGLSIIFTKMISQLSNVQANVSMILEYGYTLALKLAGYNFDSLSVEFKTSTITDELKLWQAREIKYRVNHGLYLQGLIGQDDFADAFDIETPDQKEPRDIAAAGAAIEGQKKKEEREKDKDKSDKGTRDKNKPQPKRS